MEEMVHADGVMLIIVCYGGVREENRS